MQIKVSGKQVELSDALRVPVGQQLDAIAGKYFDQALEAQVTFGRARSFFTCDINMHAGRGLTLRGEGEAADAHAALDDAAEHLAKRLRRYRRRINDHARAAANRAQGANAQEAHQYVVREDEEAHAASAEAPQGTGAYATVIAETPTEILELSVSDAVMRMDLADQPLMMFRNVATGAFNVVYRRSDGNVGWIDPGKGA